MPWTPISIFRRVRSCRLFSTNALRYSEARNTSSKSGPPQQTDLLEQYRGLVALGRITYDENQVRAVMQLRRLRRDLDGYAPPALPSRYTLRDPRETQTEKIKDGDPRWWLNHDHDRHMSGQDETMALTRIQSHAEELAALTTPKGLLITGPPGSGKSFLIDMWFASLPTPYKARKHYSQLVLEIYRAVWEETQRRMVTPTKFYPPPRVPWTRGVRDHCRALVRTGTLSASWAQVAATSHAQPPLALVIARRLLLQHWLLVLDELQLLDVSSATLLADVLSWFWRMGGVLIGSSNRVPEDLYQNGVQRQRLEPFVETLKVRSPLLELRGKDWRVVRAKGGEGKTWFMYAQRDAFEEKLRELVGSEAEPRSYALRVFGRSLDVPWASGDVCKFSFDELCEESLGPADYFTLASTYRTFAITSIPVLKISDKNQARRFISLIDALYEARCRLLCLAEAQPEGLFFPDGVTVQKPLEHVDVDVMMAESVAESQDMYRPNISSYDAPKMEEAPVQGTPLALETLSTFSGKEEQFAYKRALSRLLEMTSASYALEERWNPLSVEVRKWEGKARENVDKGCLGAKYAGEKRDTRNHEDDFAMEAAHLGTGASSQLRPQAPRIRSHHIWGVSQTSSGES